MVKPMYVREYVGRTAFSRYPPAVSCNPHTDLVDKGETARVERCRKTMGRMYAYSMSVNKKRVPLCELSRIRRHNCISKMQSINRMYALRCAGQRGMKVGESTVIQSILLLDWIIDNEFAYFMNMEEDVLSGICVILSAYSRGMTAEHAFITIESIEAEHYEICCLVAYMCYGSEQEADVRQIVEQVQDYGCEILARYEKLDFVVFLQQYCGLGSTQQNRLVHFLHELMTQNVSESWFWNTYETFVEVVIRESSDTTANCKIMDDHALVCV